MGLIIILGTVFSVLAFVFIKWHSKKMFDSPVKGFKEYTATILLSLLTSILFSALFTTLISQSVEDSMKHDETTFCVVKTTKHDLLPFKEDTYIVADISEDIPMFVVRTEEIDQRFNITDTSIKFNSDEAYMEELKLDYANGFIRWLLVKPYTCKYNVYTPQSTIDGLYKLIVD